LYVTHLILENLGNESTFAQFQFVGTDALESVNNEFHMIPEISAALDAFTKKYWEIIYHGGNCPYN